MAQQLLGSSIWWQWMLNFSDRTFPLLMSLLLLPVPLPAVATPSFWEVAQTPAASTQDIRQLEQGKPIERQIAAGETHSYRVTVQAGQYLQLTVQQKGVDLVVTLLAPDGEEITEIDDNDVPDSESIETVLETSGSYLVEIRTYENSDASGDYEVKIEEQRQVTSQDRNRKAAQQAFKEAEELESEETAESLQQAIEKYEQALLLFQDVGDKTGEATTLSNIANVYYNNLKEKQKALNYLNQALPLWRAMGNKSGEATTLYNMAQVYDALGEKQKALDYLNQVIPLRRAIGDKSGEALILTNIGTFYGALNENHKALEYLNQALPLWDPIGEISGVALTLTNIGSVYDSLGEKQKALDYFNRALPLHRWEGFQRGEAYTLNNIAHVYDDLGEKQKALDYYKQALPLMRVTSNKAGEALVLNNIGSVYYRLGEKQKALDYLNRSLSLSQAVGDRTLEAYTMYSFAYLERERGNLKEALSYIEKTIAIIESLRTKFTSQELRTSFFATKQDEYQFYIDLLMQLHKQQPTQGYDAKALETSERARARSLLELLTEANADIRQGVDPDLLQKERTLQAQLNTVEQQRIKVLSATHTEAQAKELETQLLNLQAQYQQIQTEIRAKSPRYAALTQPQPLSLQQIQQQALDENTLLLEYSLGEERSYLWAVTKTGIISYELPKRADIEAVAKQFRDVINDPLISQDETQVAKTSAQLSQVILAPVANQLGEKRLLIVGDGVLQYIPFAALSLPVTNGNPTQSAQFKPLIVNHEIVYLPSASTLAISRRELTGRSPALKTMAMLADPVFATNDERLKTAQAQASTAGEQISTLQLQRAAGESGVNLKRLPFTRQEAEAIMKLIPATEREQSFDFDASRAAATSSQLNQYRIVHFATHGILNSTHPELSGIVMSLVDKDGNSQNGFLRLNDIFNLKLSADMVVLSACKTASGQNIRGEGIVGLTRGFMYAGAARVVASLWSVNDPATAELMTKFYQRYLKESLPAAAALRAAQIELWKQEQWRSPYYWAAFTLQGEWR